MLLEEMKRSIISLIYYLKYYGKDIDDLNILLETIKLKVITSTLIKNKDIVQLFQQYSIEQIKEALEDSYNSEKKRYYTYKIISRLLAGE